MKKSLTIIAVWALMLSFSGCAGASTRQTNTFTKKSAEAIRVKAKTYPLRAFQEGTIRPNSYVRFTGDIQKKDTAGQTIDQGDRFILVNGKTRVQVLGQRVPKNLKVGDRVTVYGEYYGFIKSLVIDRVK